MGCEEPPHQLQTQDNLKLADSAKLHALTLNLTNTTEEGGVLRIELKRSNDQLLEERSIDMNEFTGSIVFSDILEGYYSIQVYQDIDANQQLNMDGPIPQEPIGFSNNPILQGPPTFAVTGFEITSDLTQEVQLIDYR
nr:DUF2141 domain-containing protein [Vibrio amylolyticus]